MFASGDIERLTVGYQHFCGQYGQYLLFSIAVLQGGCFCAEASYFDSFGNGEAVIDRAAFSGIDDEGEFSRVGDFLGIRIEPFEKNGSFPP